MRNFYIYLILVTALIVWGFVSLKHDKQVIEPLGQIEQVEEPQLPDVQSLPPPSGEEIMIF